MTEEDSDSGVSIQIDTSYPEVTFPVYFDRLDTCLISTEFLRCSFY